MHNILSLLLFIPVLFSLVSSVSAADSSGEFTALFPKDGVPEGWSVRQWDDVKNPADQGVLWQVKNGVLQGSEPRGTWLVSEKEYGDFVLEFEWKLGERGNSGCGLRFPLHGDPAFDGLELQMVDPRYYPSDMKVPATELTGGLYRAVAPKGQVYKPGEWNKYEISCRGATITVVLNGVRILNVNLDENTQPTKRHTGTDAPSLKDRPRKGRIGFQELSRDGGRVELRNAKIKILD